MRNYFKPAVFLLSLWPLIIIGYQIFYNKLGPEPVDRIINHFGEWTLIFIFLTLSMTPLKKITKSLEWIKFRRMLGLFAFFYASIHMLSYVGLDYRFDFEPLIDDVLKKKFVFIGFSAWCCFTWVSRISVMFSASSLAPRIFNLFVPSEEDFFFGIINQ